MDVIRRMKGHLTVKADLDEVIQAQSILFTPKPVTESALMTMFPVGISAGQLQGSMGDTTLDQTQPDAAGWTWVTLDLDSDTPLMKGDLYPYYRPTEDCIITFAALG